MKSSETQNLTSKSTLPKIEILIVQDSYSSAEAIASLLIKAGFKLIWHQVSTQADYLAHLSRDLDLILVDDCQTQLPSKEALRLWVEKKLTIPVLIINGEGKIPDAVAAIKAGASNYLTSAEMKQLPLAVEQVLQEQFHFCVQLRKCVHESEQQLQKLITENADGIIAVDEQGIVQFVNPAALQLLQKSSTQLLGESFGFPVVNGDYLEVDIPQTQGHILVAQMRVSQILWQGTTAYLVSLRDITKLKQAEEEKVKLLAEAQAANRAKDEFLAILSHELRTPLNPIVGWSQLISGGTLNQTQIEQGVEIIHRNAMLQAQLIEEILDLSRIVRGKLQLEISKVNLSKIVTYALENLHLAAQAKSIEIITHFEPDLGLVYGDPTRLQQVIWNLLSNAVKFTSDRGRIEITLKKIGNTAQLQVTDNGKGIEPEFLPYVFDYFRQAENVTSRVVGGLGLGLAIVRHLVELHGGTVTAHSDGIGQGATFIVTLPMIDSCEQSKSEGSLFRSLKDLSQVKVLVVDDDESSRNLLVGVLKNEGAEAIATASGSDALTAIQKSHPDILVSDIVMPEMDGYQLIQRVRELPAEQGGNLSAISLSAYTSSIDAQQSLAAGFDLHLNKPLDLNNFLKVVTQLAQKNL
ncbi:multi-sensor hybrid histidine kinase [Stanieria cyanosphaera PCC 7437]|uniref:histidine kinase n=1 Tax=Stanieria cyanosphaera (strain ATCC 29371 / PCC 7437) TaxID=111780 RepID=K9XTY7_STAC7|nr:ATP-binding protein [Stanieria cyanosphaera]AFZ35541.1 multi-sensor hybrid histidine kinase [Stanieria cyanosphaera PCC 7437]